MAPKHLGPEDSLRLVAGQGAPLLLRQGHDRGVHFQLPDGEGLDPADVHSGLSTKSAADEFGARGVPASCLTRRPCDSTPTRPLIQA